MKQGWEIKKLGEVCESDLGKTLNQSKDTGELRPYLCAINVLWDKIDFTTLKETRFEDSELERYTIRKGDLLICEGGDIGRAAIWNYDYEIQYQNALHRVRLNDGVLSRFLLLYLKHLKDSGVLDARYGKGVTIKHLVKSSLLSIPIPIPPLEEQERIVKELDCLSGVIEKKKQQLKELDALAQSIFYQMFGDHITNEKGWEVKKWNDVLTIINGKNQKAVENPNGEFPIYGSGGIMGYADKYLCPKNTIVIGRKGNINKPIFVKEPFWNVDTAFGLIADNTHIAPSYLFFYCRIFDFEQLNKAVTIPSLTKSDLLLLEMPCPPIHLQQEFAEKIEAIEKQKELIKQSITQTEELFNSRMSYYFN